MGAALPAGPAVPRPPAHPLPTGPRPSRLLGRPGCWTTAPSPLLISPPLRKGPAAGTRDSRAPEDGAGSGDQGLARP